MLNTCACCAGLVKVASAVSAGYSSVEAREAELRTEINAALAKMRAYARDMEVRPMPPLPCACQVGVCQTAEFEIHAVTMEACSVQLSRSRWLPVGPGIIAVSFLHSP